MSNSVLRFVLEALATYRLTRLIVTDKILEKVREFIRQRSFRTFFRGERFGSSVTETIELPRARSPWTWLFNVVSCSWCTSVWAGGGVVALSHYQGSWFNYVVYALSLSSVAGFLSQLIERV